MLIVIKRYQNRKLYNTSAKRYITLEEIGYMIHQGDEVRIKDHVTGEDITNTTLSQVFLEQEKNKHGNLPYSLLVGLIQAGELRHEIIQSALDPPLDILRKIDNEIKRRVDILIERAELSFSEGKRLLDMIVPIETSEGEITRLEEVIHNHPPEHKLLTRRDIKQLVKQIEELTELIQGRIK